MEKYDNDFTRAHKDSDFTLDKDDPKKRECALRVLIKAGQEDLVEMLDLLNPIPRYSK